MQALHGSEVPGGQRTPVFQGHVDPGRRPTIQSQRDAGAAPLAGPLVGRLQKGSLDYLAYTEVEKDRVAQHLFAVA